MPPKGQTRIYTEQDAAILNYIVVGRDRGEELDIIAERLRAFQASGWQNLPAAPPEWFKRQANELIEKSVASERARELANVAVLQVDLENMSHDLQKAQQHAQTLQHELDTLHTTDRASQAEINDLKLQLSQATGHVEVLKARLAAYTIAGDQPVPLIILVGTVAVSAVLIVLVVFVIARLLL